ESPRRRAHASAPVCSRQARRRGRVARALGVRRHERPRARRGSAAPLQRALRRTRPLGALRGAAGHRLPGPLRQLSPPRPIDRAEDQLGKNHANVDPYIVSRVRALESLLLERGVLAPDAVDKVVRRYGESAGPLLGARAVARAWRDPDYKRLLLGDSKGA